MCAHGPRNTAHDTTLRRGGRFASWKRFLCRLDVCWTLCFFLFLSLVFTCTSAITRVKVDQAMRETWHTLHNVRITAINARITANFDSVNDAAKTYLTLHMKTRIRSGVEEIMVTLCSILASYDGAQIIRSFSAATFRLYAMTGCVRDVNGSTATLQKFFGYTSTNSVIGGIYDLNSTTYDYSEPLHSPFEWPTDMSNVTDVLNNLYDTDPVFKAAADFYDGKVSTFDSALQWRYVDSTFHLLELTYPTTLLYSVNDVPVDKDPQLFVKLTVDVSTLLQPANIPYEFHVTSALFDQDSLASKDPIVLSNTWGQETTNYPNVVVLAGDQEFEYLHVSRITDPLMRAALQHVNFTTLQRRGYRHSVDFDYDGAPATVTALAFKRDSAPSLPMVYVTAQRDITPPYTRIMNICNGVGCLVLVLLTVFFWWFIHRYLSTPLERVTKLLDDSVEAGARVKVSAQPVDGVFQMAEVRTLMQASNTAMARLRQIDTFVPEARLRQLQNPLCNNNNNNHNSTVIPLTLRQANEKRSSPSAEPMCSSYNDLTEQIMTVVYLRIQRTDNKRSKTKGQQNAADVTVSTFFRRRDSEEGGGCTNSSSNNNGSTGLAAMRRLRSADHGPFPTGATLADFTTAVQALCRIHHGTAHRIAPDGCILHFGKAVRTHFFSYAAAAAAAAVAATQQEGYELAPADRLNAACVRREALRCARQDAADAVHFAIELQRWLDNYPTSKPLPDVYALVDTGTFTCGQYRPCGSEQTLSVALGRDASRDLGHIGSATGVRVAMTEETADRVRAGVRRGAVITVDPGVRQLPVEALRTGRVGLNADVVILYEVLPGNVVGSVSWQLYSRACFDAFGFMLRGDYAAALSAFKGIADISDLEPGLMPPRLRREAARSDVVGGATSTQVERLMKECEWRLAAGVTKGYYRERRVPLSVDTVLNGGTLSAGAAPPQERLGSTGPANVRSVFSSSSSTLHNYVSSTATAAPPPTNVRKCAVKPPFLSSTSCTSGTDPASVPAAFCTHSPMASLHYAAFDLPPSFTDNYNMRWYLPRQPQTVFYAKAMPANTTIILGSGGALCTLRRRILAPPSPSLSNAAIDAPLHLDLEDTLDVSPCPLLTAEQKAEMAKLFARIQHLQHPNIAKPLAYSLSMAGTIAGIWNFFHGGTLRELILRFPRLKLETVVRLSTSVLAALLHLHDRGATHGAVCLESVIVSPDGHCQLMLQKPPFPGQEELLALPQTCYVSPLMATGALPTPACDMFCFGLMCVEAATRQPAWRWAEEVNETARDPSTDPHTAAQLKALMAQGGAAFSAAVVDGLIVPNTAKLDAVMAAEGYRKAVCETTHRLLSYDPALRPTAVEELEVLRQLFPTKTLKRASKASKRCSK